MQLYQKNIFPSIHLLYNLASNNSQSPVQQNNNWCCFLCLVFFLWFWILGFLHVFKILWGEWI